MAKAEFFRGARIKQAPLRPIKEEVTYPQFILYIGHIAVTEYGQLNREQFLQHCGLAFDAAMEIKRDAQNGGPAHG